MRLWIVAVLAVVTLRAENWPQWRGPSSLAVSSETGRPSEWLEPMWKVPVAGLGVSSPVSGEAHRSLTVAAP